MLGVVELGEGVTEVWSSGEYKVVVIKFCIGWGGMLGCSVGDLLKVKLCMRIVKLLVELFKVL